MPIKDPVRRRLQNRKCAQAYKARQRANDPTWVARQTARQIQVDTANPARTMLHSAKARAKRKGIVFAMTLADIVIPKLCPILGIPIMRAHGAFTPNSPTLDRIVPELGYISGNVHVISFRANLLKNDGTLAEFQKLVRFLESASN